MSKIYKCIYCGKKSSTRICSDCQEEIKKDHYELKGKKDA